MSKYLEKKHLHDLEKKHLHDRDQIIINGQTEFKKFQANEIIQRQITDLIGKNDYIYGFLTGIICIGIIIIFFPKF
jgi:hypothetical protein